MRSSSTILLILVLILAACGGSPTPTATVSVPTATAGLPTQPSAAGETLPTSQFNELQVTVAVALPGTPIPASGATIEPVSNQPFQFDRVLFTQTGGLSALNLQIEVFGDGRVVRDGAQTQTSSEVVANIASLIDTFDFFRVSGQFIGAGASADTYTYSLTVDSGGSSRTIISQDGFTPPALFAIYDAVRALGQ